VTSRSVGRSHGIDGDYLGQVYKDHLSGYEHWDQKAHAKEWILTAKNMGRHLSIDESMYCGRLYTFVSNKDAHGGRGTIIAIIAGVKAATVLRWLLEIPEEERRGIRKEGSESKFPEPSFVYPLPTYKRNAWQYRQMFRLLQYSQKPYILCHKMHEKRTNFCYYLAHILPTPLSLSFWPRGWYQGQV